MKVELTLKNGKTRAFHPQVAKVLERKGLGYQTREMRPDDNAKWERGDLGRSEADVEVDELETLKAEADRRGIKYHHRAGVAKLRELLAG